MFLTAAVLTLAVGIGSSVTIFSLVNAMHLRPMPFGDRSDRLITVHRTNPVGATQEPNWGTSEISYRDMQDYRGAAALDGIGAYMVRNFVLSGDEASAERVVGGSVSPELFKLLGIEPMLGRHFLPEEAAAPGFETSVMLTYRLWQRRYGADPAIVGKTIIVNDGARTVIGVLPEGFQFPVRDQLYMPLRLDQMPRSNRNVNAVGLLKEGATVEQARAQIASIAKQLESTFPDTNRGYGVQVVPIRMSYIGRGAATMSIVLMSAVGFVLLIVCANLANLMLVRGAARQRELAVRAAMGASRTRLMWSSLCESVLLAVPGAVAGLLASQWALDAIERTLPQELPYWIRLDADIRVIVFTAGVAVFTAIAVGLLPSVRAARPDFVNDLKEAGRGLSLGRGGQRWQSVLAVAQVALCFGLLIGANLMVRSFLAMETASLGFDHRPLLSARAYLAGDAYDGLAARARFIEQVAKTLGTLPGAGAAAVTTAIPGDDGGAARQLVIDGRTETTDVVPVQQVGITREFFDVIGMPIVSGRTFTSQEVETPETQVALINQSLAKRLWPADSPLDRRVGFRFDRGIEWFRIVGVVPDVHYEEVGEETDESRLTVYIPYGHDGSRGVGILVRSTGDPQTLVNPVRDALRRLNPGFPVFRLMPMTELRRFTTWEQRFIGNLMGLFAVMALALACLGIYGLISYSVGRRSREIGVRLALGARPRDVIAMLVRESAKVGGAGLAIGLIFGILIARGLTKAIYGVAVDPWLFITMAAPLAAAMALATWWPARRAARMDPTVALRDE